MDSGFSTPKVEKKFLCCKPRQNLITAVSCFVRIPNAKEFRTTLNLHCSSPITGQSGQIVDTYLDFIANIVAYHKVKTESVLTLINSEVLEL